MISSVVDRESKNKTRDDIQRKTAFDGTYASAGTSTTTTFTDSTVTTGTTYWYKVTGINTSGTSDISNVVKLTYVEATE